MGKASIGRPWKGLDWQERAGADWIEKERRGRQGRDGRGLDGIGAAGMDRKD